MSVNSSETMARGLCVGLLLVVVLPLLGGCVSRADQVTSAEEAERFARLLDSADGARPAPELFRARAEEMVRTPLTFHGRVVDETGAPVPDATVRILAFDRLLEPFDYPYFARSTLPPREVSRSGRFRIRGLPAAGLFLEIGAPGYLAGEGASRLYFPDDPELAEGGSRRAPVEFQLLRGPDDATLAAVRSGARGLPPDAAPVEIDVRGFEPVPPPPGAGDVAVRCERPAVAERAGPFPWSCTLSVRDGGVQPLRLGFDQAPEDGYAPEYTITMAADPSSWSARDERDLVLRFPDGTYGRYTLKVRLEGRDYVALDGVWNPTGGRSLR